ncbi:MAG: 50S ribosomal protein L5 [Planctomycetes bacterium RIFCSPHIGHO2_02_FULL_50_42]|jgi:large subunit ribosomal protein L5|uniref:Large ribosomal subunit protein uL5 n=1 Tax=uncultured planctomycete Rifle_16ft_4_minimus_3099 TaxID=1665203 RepID=A0A0H4TN05_9BACT|nr:50S ribosomal protein L5, large subunit ribosomal protein L5 [uncultured planctomycete Rifle_16ft_4_minimus_3099]OHB37106.1 MAG: 50S ribosomal protein L5 [Planctomycetes bacterium GWA2_50_13]OHB89886.1 MAG: 50S ribosomal protein L5 [Planctomycetes bacterium RIFCSPHIGHO2_02_FULL_50_42]OHB91405.1 MAG: 50S ribosomal protein L5 [Planctomycetes bacterium RIFCSPHIGHO2_12_FULL_51_37]OHB95519.1 MAG: 50S ribosomal protein L5 [Planctomycetes bacterium RIFCSPLOWO2_02_FULL_50_16]OHC05168.1 MAG: 50S rib
MARLLKLYKEKIIPEMVKKYGYKNVMAVPRISKIVVNMGVGKALENKKCLEDAQKQLGLITGQKPVVTKAKKSLAEFKLRKGNPIGCKATLRGVRMYEFLDRLVNVTLPRIKDFRGLSSKGFDEAGNYTLGIHEQLVFPEISPEDVEFVQGMDITIVISGKQKERSKELLRILGTPFRD